MVRGRIWRSWAEMQGYVYTSGTLVSNDKGNAITKGRRQKLECNKDRSTQVLNYLIVEKTNCLSTLPAGRAVK